VKEKKIAYLNIEAKTGVGWQDFTKKGKKVVYGRILGKRMILRRCDSLKGNGTQCD